MRHGSGGGRKRARRRRRGTRISWCSVFGKTHNPRAEDCPVIPCEKMVVELRPVDCFEWNPGLDVRVARQDGSRSVSVVGDGDEKGRGGFVKSVL